ncbi:ATP-binding protein [Paraburkholderia acidiphila]|uniref:Signal transduction histidine-protein kinase/phosphatase MprB n=1 Tax=Paraburkholderia acidiphila TaxID=2571747 RepID=A0A7Z2G883_9BURK|nr:ATP-binding protein [Paraburkholderia acidiphila]QGZ56867.1 HAMP domain-containing protein [Paraburkholderia acidiphila]
MNGKRSKLSRQIVLSMSLVSVITTLIAFVGSYIIYGLLFTLWPPPPGPPENMFIVHAPDYVIFASLLLAALVVAIVLALRLAKRIIAPLNSLAEGARRIAEGDLAARALPGDLSLGETANLVDDFNTMAVKLADMAAEMTFWNAAVAHELRTPLTILKGRLQGIRDGVFEPTETLVDGLLIQVDSLSRLVDDLRVVTLQNSGHLEMHFVTTDISVEIQHVVDSVRSALLAAGFSLDLATRSVLVECDGTRIRQAILALIDNARRYATPGQLIVRTTVSDLHVILQVEDEGPGIAPDFARQAFEPFTRAELSRSRSSGGTGLGLSVVRAIALAHGGTVRYRRSAVGGSIFEMALPRASL